MGKVIKISRENLQLCERALVALRRDLKKLAEMTKEYPVECGFAGFRFVFTNEAEIHELIEALDAKISAFKAAA
jgi:hypothetical protein